MVLRVNPPHYERLRCHIDVNVEHVRLLFYGNFVKGRGTLRSKIFYAAQITSAVLGTPRRRVPSTLGSEKGGYSSVEKILLCTNTGRVAFDGQRLPVFLSLVRSANIHGACKMRSVHESGEGASSADCFWVTRTLYNGSVYSVVKFVRHHHRWFQLSAPIYAANALPHKRESPYPTRGSHNGWPPQWRLYDRALSPPTQG